MNALRPELDKLGLSDDEQDKRLLDLYKRGIIYLIEGSPATRVRRHIIQPKTELSSERRFYYVGIKRRG